MLSIEQGVDYDGVDEAELPYKHVRNLGHGHSGTVEEVQDQMTGKFYARKTIQIPISKAMKAARTKVFLNEAQIIRRLGRHHHIVNVFATYVTKRYFGIILQPVATNGDLEHFIAEYSNELGYNTSGSASSRLGAMTCVLEQGFGCLAAGLAFMHKKKIRHKDIKPHNILVHDGILIYTDFGYSFDSNGFTGSTSEGRPDFLTRRYSAPEVLLYDQRNSKSDVYSLGCVFIDIFAALTQSLLFDDDTSFSHSMDKVHGQLDQIQSDRLAILPSTIKSMTALDQKARLNADQLVVILNAHAHLHCAECGQKCSIVAPSTGIDIQSPGMEASQGQSHVESTALSSEVTDNVHLRTTTRDQWFWSPEYGNYYLMTIGADGNYLTRWAETAESSGTKNTMSIHSGIQALPGAQYAMVTCQGDDPASSTGFGMAPSMPPSFGHEVRFSNIPDRGLFGTFDQRYRLRTKEEAHKFFATGRVFAMLWSEPAGAIANNLACNGSVNTSITAGPFGQGVFSQIRRFVIMEVNLENHFVYACAIFTYNGQGTLKYGCTASEHAPVYMTGSQATTYQGELERGMTKAPIEITPIEGAEIIHPASRLRLGKHYPIGWGVKAREIGIVAPRHRSRLMMHYRDEQRQDFDNDEGFLEEND